MSQYDLFEEEVLYSHPNVKSRLRLKRKHEFLGSFEQIDEQKEWGIKNLLYPVVILNLDSVTIINRVK